jgi:predicted CXXCH cytochrome family protein
MNRINGSARTFPRRSRGETTGLLVLSVLATFLSSCADTNTTLLAPPMIAGAEVVGSEACVDCHADITRDFDTAVHSVLMAHGDNALGAGCEGCHGAGSKHVESGGEAAHIINPSRSPETCYQCHVNKRGDFSLPYSHPVSAGLLHQRPASMSCSDCHTPHEGDAVMGGGTQIEKQNDLCVSCHPSQRGPFVFEHEAMREGCVSCHDPHGSVNQKMLSERDSTLCLKCHAQEQLPAATTTYLIGGRDHASFLTRGTCFNAGCHEAVHGSNVSSSLRF